MVIALEHLHGAWQSSSWNHPSLCDDIGADSAGATGNFALVNFQNFTDELGQTYLSRPILIFEAKLQ